jgi:hypothetical protein
MRNFCLGLLVALVVSVGVAAGGHVRQAPASYETQVRSYGDFMPDADVTDGPSYLRYLDSQRAHSLKFWTDISSMSALGWEPVGVTNTVSQYQTGKGFETVVVLKKKVF